MQIRFRNFALLKFPPRKPIIHYTAFLFISVFVTSASFQLAYGNFALLKFRVARFFIPFQNLFSKDFFTSSNHHSLGFALPKFRSLEISGSQVIHSAF